MNCTPRRSHQSLGNSPAICRPAVRQLAHTRPLPNTLQQMADPPDLHPLQARRPPKDPLALIAPTWVSVGGNQERWTR